MKKRTRRDNTTIICRYAWQSLDNEGIPEGEPINIYDLFPEVNKNQIKTKKGIKNGTKVEYYNFFGEVVTSCGLNSKVKSPYFMTKNHLSSNNRTKITKVNETLLHKLVISIIKHWTEVDIPSVVIKKGLDDYEVKTNPFKTKLTLSECDTIKILGGTKSNVDKTERKYISDAMFKECAFEVVCTHEISARKRAAYEAFEHPVVIIRYSSNENYLLKGGEYLEMTEEEVKKDILDRCYLDLTNEEYYVAQNQMALIRAKKECEKEKEVYEEMKGLYEKEIDIKYENKLSYHSDIARDAIRKSYKNELENCKALNLRLTSERDKELGKYNETHFHKISGFIEKIGDIEDCKIFTRKLLVIKTLKKRNVAFYIYNDEVNLKDGINEGVFVDIEFEIKSSFSNQEKKWKTFLKCVNIYEDTVPF